MRVFRPKRKDAPVTRAEALNCTPVRNIRAEETRMKGGEARIAYPAQMRPMIAGVIRYFGGRTDRTYIKKLQLDALGTQVWDLIDGKLTVRQIVRRFADDHRLHAREAEVSVTAFLHELGKRGIIGMK